MIHRNPEPAEQSLGAVLRRLRDRGHLSTEMAADVSRGPFRFLDAVGENDRNKTVAIVHSSDTTIEAPPNMRCGNFRR